MTDQTPNPVQPADAPAVQEAAAPTESKAKAAGKSIGKRILMYVVILGVLAIGGYLYNVFTGDISTAKVGDCITETVKTDASDAKVVDCTDAKAKNKVVGIVEDKYTFTQFDVLTDNPCAAFADAEYAIFQGKDTGTGDVWCLAAK